MKCEGYKSFKLKLDLEEYEKQREYMYLRSTILGGGIGGVKEGRVRND